VKRLWALVSRLWYGASAAWSGDEGGSDVVGRVLDSVFVFVCVLSTDGVVREVHGAFGPAPLRDEDLVGKPFATVGWWSDRPEEQERMRQAIRRGALGETVRADFRVHVAADRTLVVDVTFTPLRDVTGEVTGVVGSALDVTESRQVEAALRESQFRFRQVVENIREVFWMTNVAKTRMLYVSPSYERIWGRPAEGLYASARDWIDAIHPEDRERIAHAAVEKQAPGHYAEEYRIVRPDGSIRWIRDRAFPVRDADGIVHRIAGVAEDITESKRGAELSLQARKMEALGQFACGVAHDLNNILGSILGNTELARQDVGTDHPALESLDETLRAALRAKDLLGEILTFARQQPLDRRVTDLRPLVEESARLVQATLPPGIELSVACADDVPNVMADATQIHRVLVNLCTNARQALDERPGQIELQVGRAWIDEDAARTHPDLRPGNYASVVVTDSGRGMDSATLERIFEPFFTTKPPGRGTGLGLSVTLGVMRSHDGAIVVTSRPGHGTSFRLYFPAVDASVEPAPVEEKRPLVRGDGRRILHIDDDPAFVSLTGKMLARLGYEVIAFTEAAKALEAFRAAPHRFDLVITDLTILGFSGVAVAAELIAIRSDLPVVLTSGYVADGLRQAARNAGVRDVVSKAAMVNQFCEAIQRALRNSTDGDGGDD